MRWIFILTSLLQLAACTNPPWPRGSMEELYPLSEHRPKLRSVHVSGLDIQLASTTGKGTTPIVFVHGHKAEVLVCECIRTGSSSRAIQSILGQPCLSQFDSPAAPDQHRE